MGVLCPFLMTAGFLLLQSNIVHSQEFEFANYYQSHMVLHHAPAQSRVWGWALLTDIGAGVQVTLTNTVAGQDRVYNALVTAGPLADRAMWSVLLDPIVGSTNPYNIVVSLGAQQIQIVDVLFGDVWVCSGQSNMQHSVIDMTNGTEELLIAENYPNIRLLFVALTESATPQHELMGIAQPWSLPTSATLRGFSAVCWVYGKEVHQVVNYPIGLIESNWGGTRIEAWSSPDALAQCTGGLNAPAHKLQAEDVSVENSPAWWKNYSPQSAVKTTHADQHQVDPNDYSALWNAMIHPLLNMTITGAIWYQGESNAYDRRDVYNCTFHAMIEDWRAKFNERSFGQTSSHFPFGFVQLGPNGESSKDTTQGFTDIRWHQTADIGYTPNRILQLVFMSTAVDTEDFYAPTGAIHPRDKITVAHRLALSGLSVAYGRASVLYRGPNPSSLLSDTAASTLTIEFNGAQGTDRIRLQQTFGFDVCCSVDGTTSCPMSGTGGNWNSVNIVSNTDYTVTLSWQACAGQQLTGLRYLWKETPCLYLQCPIYGSVTNIPTLPYLYQGLITTNQRIQL